MLFKNFTRKPIRHCCTLTGTTLLVEAGETIEVHPSLEALALDARLVPLSDIEDTLAREAAEAAAIAVEQEAADKAEAEAAELRAQALAQASDNADADLAAKRSAAAVKAAETRAKNAKSNG